MIEGRRSRAHTKRSRTKLNSQHNGDGQIGTGIEAGHSRQTGTQNVTAQNVTRSVL